MKTLGFDVLNARLNWRTIAMMRAYKIYPVTAENFKKVEGFLKRHLNGNVGDLTFEMDGEHFVTVMGQALENTGDYYSLNFNGIVTYFSKINGRAEKLVDASGKEFTVTWIRKCPDEDTARSYLAKRVLSCADHPHRVMNFDSTGRLTRERNLMNITEITYHKGSDMVHEEKTYDLDDRTCSEGPLYSTMWGIVVPGKILALVKDHLGNTTETEKLSLY